MGTDISTTTPMALSVFDSAFFPLTRGARSSFGHLLSPRSGFFDTNLFHEMDQRRHSFMKEMEVPQAQHAREGDPRGYSQSFSYSSSTFSGAGSEPVSRHTETFRGADGQVYSRTSKSIGEKRLQEAVKGGETTRTLHNLAEDDLEYFNQAVEQHSARWPFSRGFSQLEAAPSTAAEVEAPAATSNVVLSSALESDLSKVKQAHQ